MKKVLICTLLSSVILTSTGCSSSSTILFEGDSVVYCSDLAELTLTKMEVTELEKNDGSTRDVIMFYFNYANLTDNYQSIWFSDEYNDEQSELFIGTSVSVDGCRVGFGSGFADEEISPQKMISGECYILLDDLEKI